MGSKVKTILLTILILFSIDIITLILLTKYSSMFSWNSGDKKVSSALSLISGSETRRGSIAGIWGINPFNRVRDIVRNRVQGQTLKSKKLSGNPPKITENPPKITENLPKIHRKSAKITKKSPKIHRKSIK